jgi:hypothetical protein
MALKPMIVEWIDVAKKINDDAFDETHDVDNRLFKMKTIGWLYQESEKTVLLVQEFDGNKDALPRDWVAIPRVLIEKITPITKEGRDGKRDG